LCEDAKLASVVVTQDNLEKSGANVNDLTGIIDHVISLATVNIAIILMERDGQIKVSLRSNRADVSGLASDFGGGGHKLSSGFSVDKMPMDKLLEKIKNEIKKRGLLDEL
jgi:phosphoesterase RecJ-like protein